MLGLSSFFPSYYTDHFKSIKYENLYKKGYRGLIFDIDNTLVPHGDDSTHEVDEFFNKIHKIGFKTILLSNNNEERIKRFNQNIDTLYIDDAGKPEVDSFNKAVEMLGVKKTETLVIGDTIFTDIVGANRAGISSILVKYIGHDQKGKKGFKRRIEKVILWFYKLSPYYNKLEM